MPSWAPTVIFVPLIGLLLYRRFKRTFGRQRVQPGRMWFRIALLGALAIVSTLLSRSGIGILSAQAGAVVGIVLGVVGLRHTHYERVGDDRFYTTKPWVGIAVSALFLGRLAARLFTVYTTAAATHAPGGDPFAGASKSPLTLAIFCVVAAYYIVFSIGVMRRSATL
jgi:hypothetical protein